MAEIFGAVVAGITIGGDLIKLGRYIQKAIKGIKNSRKDIEKLASEAIIFAGIYRRFLHACKDDQDANGVDFVAIQSLMTWATTTAGSLDQLLHKVEALLPRIKSRSKYEEKAIAHIVWFGSKSTVKALRDSLSVARESINGFTHLIYIKEIRNQIGVLRRALHNGNERRKLEAKLGTRLETRIRELGQEITETEEVHRETRKVLQNAENKVAKHRENSKIADSIPATEQLAKITETLDQYASELLPSAHLHSRAGSRRSASSASGSESVYSSRAWRYQPESTSNPVTRGAAPTARSSTMTSLSSSQVSSRSSLARPRASSSLSTVSIPTVNIPIRVLPRTSTAEVVPTEPSFRRKEYMNDPNGNILSPPIVRPPSPLTVRSASPTTSPLNTVQIGDYTITLEATQLKINHHSLRVNDYNIGLAFFDALKQYPQQLASLEKAIENGEADWEGIPGWFVNPTDWTADMSADSITSAKLSEQ